MTLRESEAAVVPGGAAVRSVASGREIFGVRRSGPPVMLLGVCASLGAASVWTAGRNGVGA